MARLWMLWVVCVFPLSARAATPRPPPAFQVNVQGHGRPVILIPGLTCSGSVWDATVAHLAGHDEVHVLTLAGFGGASPVAGPLLPAVRTALEGYIREHRLKRPVLIGHSVGAVLAYEVGLDAPDLVGGILAVDGVPFLPALMDPTATVSSVKPMATGFRAQMEAQTPEQFQAAIRQTLAAEVSSPMDQDAVARDSLHSDPKTVAEVMYELLTTDLRPRMASLHLPILLLGAAKGLNLAKAKRAYEAQLEKAPHARVEMDPNARHFLMLDDPTFFFTRTDAFLKEVAP